MSLYLNEAGDCEVVGVVQVAITGSPGDDALSGTDGGDTIITRPGGPVEDLVCGGGTDTVILKGFPADTPTTFPIIDPLTGGVYENSAWDCEVVIRG